MAQTYQGVNITAIAGGGGGGGTGSPYIRNFLVADWSGPVSSEYTLSVPESSHGKGTEPTVTLYQLSGANYEQVEAFIQINASGDIAVKVPDNIDGRFDGKLVIL